MPELQLGVTLDQAVDYLAKRCQGWDTKTATERSKVTKAQGSALMALAGELGLLVAANNKRRRPDAEAIRAALLPLWEEAPSSPSSPSLEPCANGDKEGANSSETCTQEPSPSPSSSSSSSPSSSPPSEPCAKEEREEAAPKPKRKQHLGRAGCPNQDPPYKEPPPVVPSKPRKVIDRGRLLHILQLPESEQARLTGLDQEAIHLWKKTRVSRWVGSLETAFGGCVLPEAQ